MFGIEGIELMFVSEVIASLLMMSCSRLARECSRGSVKVLSNGNCSWLFVVVGGCGFLLLLLGMGATFASETELRFVCEWGMMGTVGCTGCGSVLSWGCCGIAAGTGGGAVLWLFCGAGG